MHLSGTALGYYNGFHAKRLDFMSNLYMLSHYFCPFFIWRNNWTTGINKAISLIISVTLKDWRLFLMFEVTFFDIKLLLLPLTKVRDYVPCRTKQIWSEPYYIGTKRNFQGKSMMKKSQNKSLLNAFCPFFAPFLTPKHFPQQTL